MSVGLFEKVDVVRVKVTRNMVHGFRLLIPLQSGGRVYLRFVCSEYELIYIK
jgi:hypothetical protein